MYYLETDLNNTVINKLKRHNCILTIIDFSNEGKFFGTGLI